MLPVNYLAVVIAALVNFIIGFLMHGPIAGKTWMKLAGVTPTGNEKFKDMIPQMIKNFIANLVFAYVFAVGYLFATTSPLMGGSGAWNGMVYAFWIWLGYVVTTTSIEVIWMKRSPKLWMFECFSSLLAILAMGAIIASM